MAIKAEPMVLIITDRKYYKVYDGSGNSSRWQTHVIAEDITTSLQRHAIKCEVTSDEFDTLISWSIPGMQFWIGIECIDTNAPSFQLSIGAGKRVMFFFSRSFPDSVFINEPWMLALKNLAASSKTSRNFDVDKIAERHRQIGAVLLRDWDPIGVKEVPEAQDEYDSYIRGVYDIAMQSRSAQAIAEHLAHIENKTMGLWGRRPKNLLPVAQKILNLVTDL